MASTSGSNSTGAEVFRFLLALGLGIATALFTAIGDFRGLLVIAALAVYVVVLGFVFRQHWSRWGTVPARTWVVYIVVAVLLVIASTTLRLTDAGAITSTILGPLMSLALYVQLRRVAEHLDGSTSGSTVAA